MDKKILATTLVAACLSITGCKDNKKNGQNQQAQTIVVHASQTQNKIYYNGALQPIANKVVMAPYDGYIQAMHFTFGSNITKGELLFDISSKSLSDDYKKDLKAYFSAKDELAQKLEQKNSSIVLYQHGLIPKETYTGDMSTYNNSAISFYQAKHDLEELLTKLNIPSKSIESLNLNDYQRINKLLNKSFDKIPVYAPTAGVAQMPPQSLAAASNNSDDKTNADSTIAVGSTIKTGQALVNIGDMTGVATTIKVEQGNINKIKVGNKVTATSASFPNIVLHGTVTKISDQADPSQSGEDALFNVNISFPHIAQDVWKKVKIGMMAQMTIFLKPVSAIVIPINYVKVDAQGKTYVNLVKDGKVVKQPVLTGTASVNQIRIISGLNKDDKITTNS